MNYWVLPLFNFMPGWRNVSTAPRSRASRVARLAEVPAGLDPAIGWPPETCTDRAHFISFRLDGRPAAIEPLPNYEESRCLLRKGGERRRITAVAVGEVGDRDAFSAALWDWFPIDIFEALGFANGIPVGSPVVEFVDADGAILWRHAVNFGHPVSYWGRPVIDTEAHGGVGELLTRFLSWDKGGRLYLRAAMSHAMRGGLRSHDTEDRLASLFRGLESVCKAQGFAAQNLAHQLDGSNRALADRVLEGAARDLRSAAARTRGGGDARQARALETIASRVRNANNKDKNFGSQLQELLDRLGLHDVVAMEAARAPGGWLQTVNRCRNDVVHNGFLDIFCGAYDEEEIEGMMIHLHDLLVRVVLRLLGYGGTYQPTIAMALADKTTDWVSPDTPPPSLGYFRS